MFPKKEMTSQKQFDIIVGKHSTIEGNIRSEGSVRIDGIINGDIVSAGDVLIGIEAKAHGHIEAENVEISGSVEGDINARGAFRIFESGTLFGNINVASFAIDAGGVFEGMCHINVKGVKSTRGQKDYSLKDNYQQNKEKQLEDQKRNKEATPEGSQDKK
jgi:cytoskeletal protein CcmA (bactofilin family)